MHLNFPDELYGETIEGIDVAILNSDSLRLVDAYVKQGAELSEIQLKMLHLCDQELKIVIPKLEGEAQKYFRHLHHSVAQVLKKLEQKES